MKNVYKSIYTSINIAQNNKTNYHLNYLPAKYKREDDQRIEKGTYLDSGGCGGSLLRDRGLWGYSQPRDATHPDCDNIIPLISWEIYKVRLIINLPGRQSVSYNDLFPVAFLQFVLI